MKKLVLIVSAVMLVIAVSLVMLFSGCGKSGNSDGVRYQQTINVNGTGNKLS